MTTARAVLLLIAGLAYRLATRIYLPCLAAATISTPVWNYFWIGDFSTSTGFIMNWSVVMMIYAIVFGIPLAAFVTRSSNDLIPRAFGIIFIGSFLPLIPYGMLLGEYIWLIVIPSLPCSTFIVLANRDRLRVADPAILRTLIWGAENA